MLLTRQARTPETTGDVDGRTAARHGQQVGALKRLRAGDGQLRLAAAPGDVARLLHNTGLDKVLPLYPDVARALEL